MIDVGYDAFDDPYCYKGTGILRNKAGLRDAEALEAFELEMTTLRADEPLPGGRFGPAHYRAVHRHLFQDVYSWAGRYRTVRTSKGGNPFCFPEHISAQMDALFAQLRNGLCLAPPDRLSFVGAAAEFLGELNAIHPFREGNGGGGGPLFVGLPVGHWAPDRASSEAKTPDGPFVIAKPGDKLSPQNSHHDNCTLEVVRRDGRLGVLATAHLHLPGLEPESASAFMPAVD